MPRDGDLPHLGVQRCKEHVLLKDLLLLRIRSGGEGKEGVQERRLSRVRVADKRHPGKPRAQAHGPLGAALSVDGLELPSDLGELPLDVPPVELKLFLTGTLV